MPEDQQEIHEIIRTHKRRLRFLRLKEARLGYEAPPSVLMEIEDIEDKITQLQTQIQNEDKIAQLQAEIQEKELRRSSLDIAPPEPYLGIILLVGQGSIYQNQNPLGQASLDAIAYHSPRLRHCWLIGIGGEQGSSPIVEEYANYLSQRGIESHVSFIKDAFNVEETYARITEILSVETLQQDLHEGEVISDLTGATKLMSIAMLLACGDRWPVQYMVRQPNGSAVPLQLRYRYVTS